MGMSEARKVRGLTNQGNRRPLLSPTTFFLLVVNIVYAFFDTFGIIDAATSGGAGQATETKARSAAGGRPC